MLGPVFRSHVVVILIYPNMKNWSDITSNRTKMSTTKTKVTIVPKQVKGKHCTGFPFLPLSLVQCLISTCFYLLQSEFISVFISPRQLWSGNISPVVSWNDNTWYGWKLLWATIATILKLFLTTTHKNEGNAKLMSHLQSIKRCTCFPHQITVSSQSMVIIMLI